jgi:hypothetical protein
MRSEQEAHLAHTSLRMTGLRPSGGARQPLFVSSSHHEEDDDNRLYAVLSVTLYYFRSTILTC